jgi:hypothetical protein
MKKNDENHKVYFVRKSMLSNEIEKENKSKKTMSARVSL